MNDQIGNARTGEKTAMNARWGWFGLLPALLLAAAILLVQVPPFVDLPYHLAVASVRADFDRVPAYPYYFQEYDAWGPNSLYHLIARGSGHPLALTPILLAASVAATAGLFLAIGRRHRAGPIFPLIAGPFAIHASVSYGFVEFIVGVPLMLAIVWLLSGPPGMPGPSATPEDLDRARSRTLRWAAGLGALLLLVFFAHAILCAFALAVVGAFAVLSARRARRVAIAAGLATVPTFLIFAAWRMSSTEVFGTESYLLFYYRELYLRELPHRLLLIGIFDHSKLGVGAAQEIAVPLAVTGSAIAAILAVFVATWRRRPPEPAEPVAKTSSARPAALAFAGVAGLAVLLLPEWYLPIWAVFQRFIFAAYVGAALVVTARAGREFAPRWLVAPLVALNVLVGAAWFEHVWSFRHNARDLIAIARTPDLHGIGAYVVADTGWRNEWLALAHASNVVMAYGQKPMMSRMYDFPFSRVARGQGLNPAYYARDTGSFERIDQLVPIFGNYGWALVHRSVPEADRVPLAALAPVVTRVGDWTIYARAPATAPVTGRAP